MRYNYNMSVRAVKKLPKSTVEIEVTVPWADIAAAKEVAFTKAASELEVAGYRPGKAPADVARKHLKDEAILEQAVRSLLPALYEEAVKGESLKPIAHPKIELVEAKENADWKIKFTIAEKPQITLGDYKEKIKQAKASSKSEDIWVPGKAADKLTPQEEEQRKQRQLNRVLETILKEVKLEVPDIILEDEVNTRLTRLVDDVQKLGMTIESYASSKQTTPEALRESYKKEAEDTYKLEFILGEIGEKEGITVEKEEIDKLFAGIKDEAERAKAQANSYLYASILRKQKTLDYLIAL